MLPCTSTCSRASGLRGVDDIADVRHLRLCPPISLDHGIQAGEPWPVVCLDEVEQQEYG
jgi:hypothetical protein